MSGVPYIGSKISLVSRSEIRYEGILAEVDPKESTIGLENVVMMGTENRKPPQEFVPMEPNIFEFVLFRSTDIKDLQVCEAPPTARPVHPNSMHYMDPAIVNYNQPLSYHQPVQRQHFQVSPPSYQAVPQKLQFGSGRSPAFEQPTPTAVSPSIKFGSGPSVSSPVVSKPAPRVVTQQQTSVPAPAVPSSVHPAVAGNIVTLTPKADQKAAIKVDQKSQPTNATSPKVMTYSTGTKKQEFVEDKGQFAFAAVPNGSYASIAGHGAKSQERVSLERPGKFRAPTQSSTQKCSSDFVFPQNNEAVKVKLDAAQEEVMRSIGGGNFYEKSSFFDNISCDAKDGKDIERFHTERSRNLETFGVAAPPNSYRGRGRGRGHGRGSYRGGYRGGRGQSTPSQ